MRQVPFGMGRRILEAKFLETRLKQKFREVTQAHMKRVTPNFQCQEDQLEKIIRLEERLLSPTVLRKCLKTMKSRWGCLVIGEFTKISGQSNIFLVLKNSLLFFATPSQDFSSKLMA